MAGKELFATLCFVIVTITVVPAEKCEDGTDISQYSGRASVTDKGLTCQKWSEQTPNPHNYTKDEHFSLDGTVEAAENFCRNVGDDPVPWCFTTNPFVRWQHCSVAACGGNPLRPGPKLPGFVGPVPRNNRKTKNAATEINGAWMVMNAPGQASDPVEVQDENNTSSRANVTIGTEILHVNRTSTYDASSGSEMLGVASGVVILALALVIWA